MSALILVLLFAGQEIATEPSSRDQPPKALSWVTNKGYPAEARRYGYEGDTRYVVTVDVNGRVADCRITQSFGYAVLDSATCEEMTKRARFTPAVENGSPVVSSFSGLFRWRIEK